MSKTEEIIFCEYCGFEYDISMGAVCPSCGYDNYIQMEEKYD